MPFLIIFFTKSLLQNTHPHNAYKLYAHNIFLDASTVQYIPFSFADKDKKAGNRFLYQNNKNKANPWSSFESDFQDDSSGNFEKKPLRNSILNEQKAAADSLAVSRRSSKLYQAACVYST